MTFIRTVCLSHCSYTLSKVSRCYTIIIFDGNKTEKWHEIVFKEGQQLLMSNQLIVLKTDDNNKALTVREKILSDHMLIPYHYIHYNSSESSIKTIIEELVNSFLTMINCDFKIDFTGEVFSVNTLLQNLYHTDGTSLKLHLQNTFLMIPAPVKKTVKAQMDFKRTQLIQLFSLLKTFLTLSSKRLKSPSAACVHGKACKKFNFKFTECTSLLHIFHKSYCSKKKPVMQLFDFLEEMFPLHDYQNKITKMTSERYLIARQQ